MKRVIYTVEAYPGHEDPRLWFHEVARPRIEEYARKCQADYHHIEVVPNTKNPGHYHKIDTLEHFLANGYDRGLFLDMDIFIEDRAPDIFTEFPEGTAMCIDYLMGMKNYHRWVRERYNTEASGRYFNTAVIVFDSAFAQFSVRHMAEAPYLDGWGEQHNWNYHMDREGFAVHELPRSWNEITPLTNRIGKNMSHYVAWGKPQLQSRGEVHPDPASFQRKYLRGDTLNVGCHQDCSKPANNLDVIDVDPGSHDSVAWVQLPRDFAEYARELPPQLSGRFDTVVFEDIFEHFSRDDIRRAFAFAKAVLRNRRVSGMERDIGRAWVNLAVRYDDRPYEEWGLRAGDSANEHEPLVPDEQRESLDTEDVVDIAREAGLILLKKELIEFCHGKSGTGLVFHT